MKRILVVDDDRRMRRTLQVLIEHMGLESVAAGSVAEARALLDGEGFDLVLTDLRMPESSGIDLLEHIHERQPRLPVILLTAYGTIQTAIDAMRKGASDYVLKPFDNENLEYVIRRALDVERVRADNRFLREQAGASWAPEDVFLALPGMRTVAELIAKVAPTAAPVLITGETGTGKELAARAIHRHGPRRERLFVPLNCAALPGELLEAELFGHARGAFTGADRARQGKFEVADGGTLFLDEIGDMPLHLQAKLLRVLEDGAIEPLGTNTPVRVDVRVLSATNQNLTEAIAERRFRTDLLFRLNTFEVHLAPLRERVDDVDVLAPLLLERFAGEIGRRPVRLADDALALLRQHRWPGNIRELRNLMERAAVLAGGPVISADFFRGMLGMQTAAASDAGDPDDAEGTLADAVDRAERRAVLRALAAAGDNKLEAAQRLGISERNLWYKLKKHGL